MDTGTRARVKDRFLGYALYRPDYFNPADFLADKEELGEQELQGIVREILEYDAQLLDVLSSNGTDIFLLSSRPRAKEFLENGGFKAVFEREEEDWNALCQQMVNQQASIDATSSKASKKLYFLPKGWLQRSLAILVLFCVVYTLVDLVRLLFR